MEIHLNQHELERILKTMTKWKDDMEALIATIAKGNGTDQATKDAVAELKTKMAAVEATNTSLQTAIDANDGFDSTLAAQIAELQTADAEHEAVIADILAKLQAGDVEGAKAAAEAASPSA